MLVAGCGEPATFMAGAGSGVAAMKAMSDDAQDRFIEAVNVLNAETTKINERMDAIDGTILVRPETLEAIKNLKGREKDPAFWIAIASILGGGFFGGQAYSKRSKS